ISLAVADALISAALELPVPVTSVSVYLVKKHMLDEFCGFTDEAS
ncbi:unnamed protein product, partial [marine sediment metagenome]